MYIDAQVGPRAPEPVVPMHEHTRVLVVRKHLHPERALYRLIAVPNTIAPEVCDA